LSSACLVLAGYFIRPLSETPIKNSSGVREVAVG
jgi:hypothetical protein